jgi:very-short-patch-repair endonuclease
MLARIASYYLDCLSHDDLGGVSVYASNRYGATDYVELTTLPGAEGNSEQLEDSTAFQKLRGRAHADRNRKSLVVGYPVRLNAVRSKTGDWTNYKVEPLFLFALDDSSGSGVVPSIALDPPQINFEALRSLAGVDDYLLLDEAIRLAEELELNSLGGARADPRTLLQKLRSIRPAWDWKDSMDPEALSTGPLLSEMNVPGIHNRAIVAIVDRPPYTRGLESDLTALKTASADGSALGAWITGDTPALPSVAEPELLEVLPLNAEQRQAVRQALTNQLTVITGPPGTGKSQVVTSIIINAAYRGQTTLFASKNNKAVDVVETRVNALGSRPVLLRLGAKEHQNRVTEYLTALLSSDASVEDEAQYRGLLAQYERLRRESRELDDELDRVIQLRNRVDQLEQNVERLRESLGEYAFSACRFTDLDELRKSASAFRRATRRANRDLQGIITRLLWPMIGGKLHAELNAFAKDFAEHAKKLATPLPSAPSDDKSIREWLRCAESFAPRLDQLSEIREYFTAFDALLAARSPEALSSARADMAQRIADIAAELWQVWLRLAPARLSPEQRRLLGEYNAQLRMILSANSQSRSVPKEVFQRMYRLFPQVAAVLPSWAVTSLSARGRVPFEPGFVDLLVIDEASQCDIASVVPLLFRAKRVVVIGDPKQLRHISALSPLRDQQLLTKNGLAEGSAAWSYSTQSLFDLATTLCRRTDIVTLKDHHRSHADIIEFSNRAFYEGTLRIATRFDRLKRPSIDEPAVRWLDAPGRTVRPAAGGARNEPEAIAIVAELQRLVDQGYRGSIGVVSPFRAQAIRIRDLIDQRDALKARLAQADCLVDTVHRFQGDERDVMLFSPVVSSGVTEPTLNFLRRNAHLFNVAVTRARAALIVVGDYQAASKCDVEYLARFAAHCDALRSNRGNRPLIQPSELGPDYPHISISSRVSEWERVFYRAAYAAGLRLVPQYNVERYLLDFAITEGIRRLAIEIDGEHYHRDWDGELCSRDQLRSQRLFELGWDVMRFWVYQVRDDLPACLNRIRKWMQDEARVNRQ